MPDKQHETDLITVTRLVQVRHSGPDKPAGLAIEFYRNETDDTYICRLYGQDVELLHNLIHAAMEGEQ